MFKIESYITPILLSYVDKYIKNFRPEDSQVSLWGGDASFHNLDLRLEVLEQELQLPFSFVSGHIHELLIHVPWTKLASEPITITINTIECILKLRGAESARDNGQAKDKQKKNQNKRQNIETPPSYVQNLINKIVSNIRIYCNNLILKYVEEDIVLSMNVKLLTFESANEKWEPAYTDVSQSHVVIRKVIAVNDLTVCLDKRNASGKIDVYQEPMLYRCSMVIHLLRTYYVASLKKASTTRLDIYCNSMEFSMTEQQIPMLLRLIHLLQALHQKELKSEIEVNKDTADNVTEPNAEYTQDKQSLAGWAWSFLPSVLPTNWDDWDITQQIATIGHVTQISFYVDNASLTFKVSESSNEKGNYYTQKKLKHWPLLTLRLQGIFMESITVGRVWVHVGMGVSQMVLLPIGHCSCSVQDVFDGTATTEYLKAGWVSDVHKSDSLFDAEAVENKGQNKIYNMDWDTHLETHTETSLLGRSAAFAVDYIYKLDVPDDTASENLSELGSDLEYSNYSEKAMLRFMVGPLKLRICSGLLHRLSSLQAAASAYDYTPYSIPKPEPVLTELQPPAADDYDALNENIPTRVVRYTMLAPVIEFQLMDHPYFQATKGYLFKKRKKTSVINPTPSQQVDLPKITLQCQCIDLRISNPMYIKRLLRTTCQLPEPPQQMFDACHTDLTLKISAFSSRLIVSNMQFTIMTPSYASFQSRTILMPQYWINPDIPHQQFSFESEGITITGTNPKIALVAQIIDKLMKMDCEDSQTTIIHSSIMQDAVKDSGFVYLEFCVEAINFKKVKTNTTITWDGSLGSIKAFVFEPMSRRDSNDTMINSNYYLSSEIQQVLVFSGPEYKDDYNNDQPLLNATIQFPIDAEKQCHPPVLMFNLREIKICLDPLMCKWLLYTPRIVHTKTEVIFDSSQRKLSRSFSDASAYETPRRARTPYESIHSSLDQVTIPQKMQATTSKDDESVIDFQEKTYDFLKKWFDVWKGLLLYGDISQCTIYFPVKSLSAVGSQGIQQAIDEAMRKEYPSDIFVVTLPSAVIRSSSCKENLIRYMNAMPVIMPETVWTKSRSSFPWNIIISDFCCYTWQNGEKVVCLSPVVITATVGLSTKHHRPENESQSLPMLNLNTSKHDIDSLGVCIHIDMTPIVISISELQVCLIASIAHGLFEVLYNVMPEQQESARSEPAMQISASNNSNLSPTLMKESTVETMSEKTARVNTDKLDNENIKLTAWIQCTIAKFSLELLAHDSKDIKENVYKKRPNLKFVLDAEDIVSSLDFQSVYLKVKSKIGSASIMHYVKENQKWKPGEFLGFVMQANDEHLKSERQEDTSFANITITRASCQHTHNLWGTAKKNKQTEDKEETRKVHSRFITEIVLSLQPIDILISPATLKNYFLVLEPLLQIPTLPSKPKKVVKSNSNWSNRSLPLTYLEFHDFRVIMPSVELGNQNARQNATIFDIKAINLTPTAVNPICRTPCRPDIYQQAAQARILNVPGSDVEDRQYQLDILGISMHTGAWSEIKQNFKSFGKTVTVLRTMSENPALEWNNMGRAKLKNSPDGHLYPIIRNFDVSVVAAPAMIYKRDVICGHSMEINFTSDIMLTISLSQIKLLDALINEASYAVELTNSNKCTKKRPKVFFPYIQLEKSEEVLETHDYMRDSGIETSDIRSTNYSIKTKESSFLRKMSDVSEKSASIKAEQTQQYIPLDVLVAGGKFSFVLYEIEKKNAVRTAYESETEHGYEASDEGSIDERPNVEMFTPLIFLNIIQPNAFLSDTQIGKKVQVTCYDLGIKIGGPDHRIMKGTITEEDFPIKLLETKSGTPNPDTGILPAFFTLKWTKSMGKTATLEIDLAKPTKILCSIPRWMYLLHIQERIIENFKNNRSIIRREIKIKKPEPQRSMEHYSKFKEIKDKFFGITQFTINMSQMILAVQTAKHFEVRLSFQKLYNHLTLSNRPEKLLDFLSLDCVTLGVCRDGETKLLLNPWNVVFEFSMFWESWQSVNSNPQLQVSIESDCIMLDVSPDKIQSLDEMQRELTEFCSNFTKTTSVPIKIESKKVPVGEKEQHYKDDLRAGAFQFVDSTSNNVDELPLPYQVMFWNRNISAMAWRYPQPRALTKVRVFPVPFKITTGSEEDQQILCHLEYWSDCHGCYQPYTQFYLSETDMCHLELPKNYPQPAVACTWRVVLTPSIKDYSSRVLVSPRALAGCIRVDSYFNKNLIPELTVAVHVTSLSINLYNYFNKHLNYTLHDDLKNFTPDFVVPEYQSFLTLTIDNANAFLATWAFETAVFDVSASIKCLILDYGFLTQQIFVEPFTSKLEISLSKTMGINFISKPIHVHFGASAAHTLGVSAQNWADCFSGEDNRELIIMTHYVICNDTNVNLRFGQVGLEDIFLPSRYCHLYAWRSQKCKQMIRVALEENHWAWSEPFRIDQDGIFMCKIANRNSMIVVTVKSLSATQKMVAFGGQLIVCNTLIEHLEMKILEAEEKDKDKDFRHAPSYIIRGKSTPPSMLVDANKAYFLRLRFFGLESAWSGDIPLMENTKCAQPWLVKVPLQERGQFLSVWCRIVVQNFAKGTKIMAMLWPLFMIRSNMPINAKVRIETPTLNVHIESTVSGLGEYQQLYCPGTIDHSHQLTFQLDTTTSSSNPYVPLNYSLVDQKNFFRKSEKEDINEILAVINKYDKSQWPYFKEELEDVEFTIEEQPLAHVQVRYQNACQYSSALLVELIPWSLLINTLGCSIAIIVNEKELCRIGHYGIVTPPKLEETFYIGVGIGGTWNLSPPLQLAKSNWTQTFYMPQITGTIPLEGCIKSVVKCEPYICVISIASSMSNEIRLLRVSSSHVITSHLNFQVQVMCFAVPEHQVNMHMPRHLEKHAFTLSPHLNKNNTGISVIQWYSLGNNTEDQSEYALYVSFASNGSHNWSCPIRVDKMLVRRSVSIQTEEMSVPVVLISQEHKGQTFISLHQDFNPQLLVENQSGTKIYCAQSGAEQGTIFSDCEHFSWICSVDDGKSCYYTMPVIAEKFPDLPQQNYYETLVFASDPESDPQGFLWSTPINVTNFNDQFVRIPFYGDVRISVKYSVHTIHVTIESVSQVEISARDIRVRLSMHEMETTQNLFNKKESPTEIDASESCTTLASTTYFSAEDSNSSLSSVNTGGKHHPKYIEVMPVVMEKNPSQSLNEIEDVNAKSNLKEWTALRVLVFIKGITFTLTSDIENGGVEKTEVASLTCDDISLTVTRSEISQICLSISDVQVDNQLYSRGSYDFPVLLVGQEAKINNCLKSLNVPIIQLVHTAQNDCLIKVDLNVETWKDPVQQCNVTGVRDIKIKIEPISAFIEDTYMYKLFEYVSVLQPSKLLVWPKARTKGYGKMNSMSVIIPEHLIWGSRLLSKPLSLRTFTIEPLSVLLSIHCSVKIYIALDQSPLQFGKFDKKRLFTTNYRLGHALTMHYLSGAIFGAGWVVGSLELLGSPGGLARAMGTGLRDFVSLPYYGLIQGPWAFLRGVSYGSASLMKHVTAGTLQSVTKLASSVARNLDRLTLDEEHLKRTEESRRQRPQGVTQGFMQGLTGLGISLLGAVGGIAHHPLQSVMIEGASPRSLVAGVGKGIVGVFTKPLSGAAELIALTGQGLLQGAGWNKMPEPRMNPVLNHVYSSPNSLLKYKYKFLSDGHILFVTEATAITNISQYDAVALILTTESLVIIDVDEDMTQRVLSLSELSGVNNNDPTLLCLKLDPPKVSLKTEDDEIVEMDPVSRARVADYVRSTVGLMQLPDSQSPEHSEMSISPDSSPSGSPNGGNVEETLLTFYVNPQSRNYFLCVLTLAKQQWQEFNFPIL
ncbi:PREDICTED: vacuolar protein sorting-associated protein 13B [Nicrophorus vespilloides]|uniref:Vacuolar protein sorting-associated protein 13B n=1 Tax=Nicrophorus vespilloides TaxID=110193 RepID=A0ABM1N3X3_NICVS|nr:PREDICTED: vacuolar protein sorting-associated protein 13B [Nicrophorus vespilloides]